MKRLLILTLTALSTLFAQQESSRYTQSEVLRDLMANNPLSLDANQSSIILQDQIVGSGDEKKNVTTAVLYSLLLPGMGELYAGNYSMGKYFTIAEGALWVTLGSFHWYGNWLENDAHSFASQHAAFSPEGKDEGFYIDIGNFQNVRDYNEQVLRSRDEHKLYDESTSGWNWDNPLNRQSYRDNRVSADEMFNNTRFVAAAIGINHIVSALNAARITIAYNKSVDHAELINIRARVLGSLSHPHGVMVSFSKTF